MEGAETVASPPVWLEADHEERPADGSRATGIIFIEAEKPGISRPVRFPSPREGDPQKFAELLKSLVEIDTFPATPWQKLPDEAKQKLISRLATAWPEPVPALILREGRPDETLEDFQHSIEYNYPEMAGAREGYYLFCRVEKDHDPRETSELFRQQFAKLAGTPPNTKTTFAQAKTTPRRLQELGALRLRDPKLGLTLRDAGKALGIYQEKSRFAKACTAAIEHFRRSIALSDTELPLHYSEGFRR